MSFEYHKRRPPVNRQRTVCVDNSVKNTPEKAFRFGQPSRSIQRKPPCGADALPRPAHPVRAAEPLHEFILQHAQIADGRTNTRTHKRTFNVLHSTFHALTLPFVHNSASCRNGATARADGRYGFRRRAPNAESEWRIHSLPPACGRCVTRNRTGRARRYSRPSRNFPVRPRIARRP